MPQDEHSRLSEIHHFGPKGELVVPLLEEQLEVNKRVVETGTVRLTKQTEEREETVAVPLMHVKWHVEHVPIHQVVSEQPAIRYEGETTVYPVVEERLVVLKELVLLEEVRVTRHIGTATDTSTHVLKRERMVEEREARPSE